MMSRDKNDSNDPRVLINRVRAKILSELGSHFWKTTEASTRAALVQAAFDAALTGDDVILLSKAERRRLFEMVVAQTGPELWQQRLLDESVEEFCVIGANEIFVRQVDATHFERLDEVLFDSEEHLVRVINQILRPMQQFVDVEHPYVQTQTPDGSTIRVSLDIFGTERTIFYCRRLSIRQNT